MPEDNNFTGSLVLDLEKNFFWTLFKHGKNISYKIII